jgi:hypothetical protein
VTVAQLIKGLKKYRQTMEVYQGGEPIKAMQIWEEPDIIGPRGRAYSTKLVVRLIRQNEKRVA